MLKKVLLGLLGVVLIIICVGWEAAVAIHDRESKSIRDQGSMSLLFDLLARFTDPSKRAKAAYEKGDYPTARKLFHNLAEQGDKTVMLRQAMLCAQGKGGPIDNVEAAKWFRVLSDDGDREAQFALGLSYEKGSGVEKDYAEALRWYRKSAKQGSPAASVNLGVMYLEGHGVPADRVEAQKWFILAGVAGQKNRALMDRSLTPEENAEARKRAGSN